MCSFSIFRFFSKIFPLEKNNSTYNPPTVPWLLEHREQRQSKLALTRGTTPTASLYRMYEYLVTGSTIGLQNEIEHFFNQPTWAVSDIPDPKDHGEADPERYAILAVLPYYLVWAFNRLIERGLPRGCPGIITSVEMEEELRSREIVKEGVSRWVKDVPKLERTLVIPPSRKFYGEMPDEASRSERFLEMNIIVEEPHVLFV